MGWGPPTPASPRRTAGDGARLVGGTDEQLPRTEGAGGWSWESRLEDKVCVGDSQGETGHSGATLPMLSGTQKGGGLRRRRQHHPEKKGGLARLLGVQKEGSPDCPVSKQETKYHGQYSETLIRCLEATSLYG